MAAARAHPTYAKMVEETLRAINDRNGSSRQAIIKYIMDNYAVPTESVKVNQYVKAALRNGVANGLMKQLRGTGANGRFKLNPLSKNPTKDKAISTKSSTRAVVHLSSEGLNKRGRKSAAIRPITAVTPKTKGPIKKKAGTTKAAAASGLLNKTFNLTDSKDVDESTSDESLPDLSESMSPSPRKITKRNHRKKMAKDVKEQKETKKQTSTTSATKKGTSTAKPKKAATTKKKTKK